MNYKEVSACVGTHGRTGTVTNAVHGVQSLMQALGVSGRAFINGHLQPSHLCNTQSHWVLKFEIVMKATGPVKHARSACKTALPPNGPAGSFLSSVAKMPIAVREEEEDMFPSRRMPSLGLPK
eukprot:1137762-Pelagomonas_calceolata.AAC.3